MAATKPAFNPPGKKGDMIFSALVKLAALIVLLLLGGIIVSLIFSSWPSIQKFGFSFLWTKEWDAPNDIYGALVPIYGTLVTSFIALLIAVPVSFGIALFLTELAPGWLRRPLGIAIELLAAIPSIVYGMWGLFIFAPLFATYFQEPVGNVLSAIPFVGTLFSGPAFGIGILAAGVILAIMIIPYIAAVMRDVFEQTPVMMKESAYGIGCTTWEVIWRIVLPFTKNGVIGGVMLGLGRALGETMAVTFIIGNTYQLDSASLYMPGNSITSALANEFAEAESGLHVAALMELGLILFVITFIVLAISKLMILRLAKMRGHANGNSRNAKHHCAGGIPSQNAGEASFQKPRCVDALNGNDGVRSVLAGLDPVLDRCARHRRDVAVTVHRDDAAAKYGGRRPGECPGGQRFADPLGDGSWYTAWHYGGDLSGGVRA